MAEPGSSSARDTGVPWLQPRPGLGSRSWSSPGAVAGRRWCRQCRSAMRGHEPSATRPADRPRARGRAEVPDGGGGPAPVAGLSRRLLVRLGDGFAVVVAVAVAALVGASLGTLAVMLAGAPLWPTAWRGVRHLDGGRWHGRSARRPAGARPGRGIAGARCRRRPGSSKSAACSSRSARPASSRISRACAATSTRRSSSCRSRSRSGPPCVSACAARRRRHSSCPASRSVVTCSSRRPAHGGAVRARDPASSRPRSPSVP